MPAMDETYWIIAGNTVTGICTIKIPEATKVMVTAINGTLDNLEKFFATIVIWRSLDYEYFNSGKGRTLCRGVRNENVGAAFKQRYFRN
ncbi:hypothetical protein KIN20_035311 [Parelaphostrongylus tenuis]|uniref:Uncharacterized protein n=1 Tax=Parelaphostrongylus tenuis TaxID=148309 RepID=A0AAD5RBM7_PARTN|nr:hypothetical protein KIN20_035311 [Parelaphostrongylus tenuis]